MFAAAGASLRTKPKPTLTIFAKKVGREKRIPFEVSVDPFCSESNMEHLRRGIAALNSGKGVVHEPIEVDGDEKSMV